MLRAPPHPPAHTAPPRPELLETQLEAIARAAATHEADVWVMAPMVTTVEEARDFVAAGRHGLKRAAVMVGARRRGQRAGDPRRGALGEHRHERPAQYALAADRLAVELAGLLDPWEPALLRLVAATVEAGRALGAAGRRLREAASDPLLALVLVGLGVASLSMAPASLPDVRGALALQTHDACLPRDRLGGARGAARREVALSRAGG